MRLYNIINKNILKQKLRESNESRVTLSFYKYHDIDDPVQFRNKLYRQFAEVGVLGRVYVATEGINGQISVPERKFVDFKSILNGYSFLQNIRLNIAIEDDGKSFYLLKIKVRSKIVADGLDDRDLDLNDKGEHLDAESFNKLTDREDTLVVDMRNHYESEVGHFENAICPDVETFREALLKTEEILAGNENRPVIMYCTGGIRCEKATAYFKRKGFKKLYQLDGGIIEYSRQTKARGLPNKFKGKNFVFDERLGERISEDIISKCHQCGAPCDTHTNCDNDACHLLFIQCSSCAKKYNDCCSTKCKSFKDLPMEERDVVKKSMTFNGSKFGKGRYKANHKNEDLDLT